MMNYDCVIVGGGPAGLNAALVLGRARRKVAVLDHGQPRNRVTHASHGYLTQDGVTPTEFRRIAYEEVQRYPTVERHEEAVIGIEKSARGFSLHTRSGQTFETRKLILAYGLKEDLPAIPGLREHYGKSLFNCPFCDGWELRDQPLVVMSTHPAVFHKTKLLLNWTRDIVVCTNGSDALSAEQRGLLAVRNIRVIDTPIAAFEGRDGLLEHVVFVDGTQLERRGGFIDPDMKPHADFQASLGYRKLDNGGIATDAMGRTNIAGLFAAGDSAYVMPSQLIYAAASGSKAAMSVMAELTEEDF